MHHVDTLRGAFLSLGRAPAAGSGKPDPGLFSTYSTMQFDKMWISLGVLAVAPLASGYGRLDGGDVLAAASPSGF